MSEGAIIRVRSAMRQAFDVVNNGMAAWCA